MNAEAAGRIAARRARAALRDTAGLLGSARVAGCGKVMTAGQVSLVVSPTGAGYAGVGYCGAVWLCAQCSAVVRAIRAADVQQAVTGHLAAGGGALFVTVTVPHDARDALRDSWSLVSEGWRWVMSGRNGRVLRGLVGYLGLIRAAEVTVGGNGWHPHLHLLVLCARPVSDLAREAYAAMVHERWSAWCAKRDWRAPVEGIGVRVDAVRTGAGLAAYIAKVQDDPWQQNAGRAVAFELVRGDRKRGRLHGRTPFELLAEYPEAERRRQARIRGLWAEWEAGSRGRSSLRWSRGLADALAVQVDSRSDEEVSAAVQSHGEPVAHFEPPTWAAVCRVSTLRERLLDIAEDPGPMGGGARVQRIAAEVYRSELAALGEYWDARDSGTSESPFAYGPPWWWAPASVVLDRWLAAVG